MQGAPSAPDYHLPFSDEFNGNRVNERAWDFRLSPRTDTEVAEPQFHLPA